MNKKLKEIKEKAIKVWDKYGHIITIAGVYLGANALLEHNKKRKEDEDFKGYVGTIRDDGVMHREEWKYKDDDNGVSTLTSTSPHANGLGLYTIMASLSDEDDETETETIA